MRKILSIILSLLVAFGASAAFGEAVVTPSEPLPAAQGWFAVPGPEGVETKTYGSLEELVVLRGAGEIFVLAEKPVEIEQIDARTLVDIVFLPDPEVFLSGEFRVRVTFEDPSEAEVAEDLEDIDFEPYREMEEEQPVDLYVWVMEIVEPEPTVQPEPTPSPEPLRIAVEAQDVAQGWSNLVPTFHLSGIPQGNTELRYAAILFDREIVELEGDTYQPPQEGIYSVRFVIVDAMGDILSASESTTLYLDWTAPEQVSAFASQQRSYAMVFSAADSLSGATEVSLNAGADWEPIENEQAKGFKFSQETILQPGMLQVRDGAGNIWQNEETLIFGALEKGGGGGYYGPSKTHSENTTGDDGKTGYAQAYLNAGEESVWELDIAGQILSLSVERAGQEAEQAAFRVSFGRMPALNEEGERVGGPDSLHAGEFTAEDDMMLLTAEELPLAEGEDEQETPPAWRLSFDGAALRTLYASGVEQLVLCVGDNAVVLPTEGFCAGTRYTELKIGGTGSRYFLYTACMREAEQERTPDEENRTTNMEFSLDVDVKEEAYRLIPREGEVIYAQGVRMIPAAWLDLLPEEYPALEAVEAR
ncbi:MAG: hypothetical protein Q4A66_10455 [Eubacteriales bacterium]|nr:hypothetical protein [Eubacteriales bacterium]